MKTVKSLVTLTVCILSALSIPVVISSDKAIAQNAEYSGQRKCASRTLSGAYSYLATGLMGSEAPFPPFVALRLVQFDGNGNFSGSGYRSSVGNVAQNKLVGKYQVNSDCTVNFNLNVFTLDGIKLDEEALFGVIVDGGKKVRIILTSSDTAPGTDAGLFEKVGY